jgi:RND superfamily putative drug exporter
MAETGTGSMAGWENQALPGMREAWSVRQFLFRLGRGAARWHWVVIAGWLLVVAGLAAGNHLAGGGYSNSYSVPGSSSERGLAVLRADYPSRSGYSGQIVFAAASGSKVDAHTDAVNETVDNLGNLAHVHHVVGPFATDDSPQVSSNGRIAYATMLFNVEPDTLGNDYLSDLDAAVAPAREAGLQVEYGGGAGQVGSQQGDLREEGLGLGLALLLLLLMFGSLVAALVPLLSATFSVVAGLSVLGLLAALFTFPTTAPVIATLLGLGVAVDYGLFMVARHRERLDAGALPDEAAGRAAATSGAAILVAGTTVVVAILGLYVAGIPFISAMGVGAAVVVAVTVVSALTLVPGLLGLAGRLVRSLPERLRVRRGGRAPTPEERARASEESIFARWGRRVARQPWPWLVGAVALLAVLSLPLLGIRFGQIDDGADPTSQTDRRAYDLISEGFGPGANGPLTVVVSIPSGQSSSDTQSMLSDLRDRLSNTEGVASVSAPDVNQAGNTAVLTAVPTTKPQAAATADLVNRVRDSVFPTVPAPTYLTGTVAVAQDFTDRSVSRLPILIGAVVLLALLLLTTAFRSLVIGLKAAAMNLLSVAASYGVIVAIFQWGWGSGLLGIDETVPIPGYVPMLMFAIIFGLSMDYEVFLLSRTHEAYLRTGDPQRSVALGIGRTGRVITTAAAVMVAVFASFVLNPDPTIKMFAVGLAVSVLIDATVIRMGLVPALLALLGDRAWWLPRRLDRMLPHVGLEEGDANGQPAGSPGRPGPEARARTR